MKSLIRNRYYDREGNRIGLFEWAELFDDWSYKIVDQDVLGPYWVSTVWMGLNHQYLDGPPLIFESAVFRSGGTHCQLECIRHTTEVSARSVHKELVEKYGTVWFPWAPAFLGFVALVFIFLR